MPGLILFLAVLTAGSYFLIRNTALVFGSNVFYFCSALFLFASTFVAAFILVRNLQGWRISLSVRWGVSACGLAAAVVLFWLSFVDVRRTFSQNALLARILQLNYTVSSQQTQISQQSQKIQEAQFALADKAQLRAHFEIGGFPSLQSKGSDQGPSGKWDCGPTVIAVNPPNLTGRVNQELRFTWDASRICLGLTIDNPGGKITFSKDGVEVQSYNLPDAYGTAYVTFSQPGYYSATLSYQVGRCRNIGGSQPCNTTGNVTMYITQ